jgi:hypothetical protein
MESYMENTIMKSRLMGKGQAPRRIPMNDEEVRWSDDGPTREEIEKVTEAGGPWITLTFTSDDQMFEQKRVLSLEQAGAVVRDLAAEIESAKRKYNIPDKPEVRND